MAGLGAYLGSYLGGLGLPLTVVSVQQTNTNAVRVVFSREPLRFNANASNDGLHLDNYELSGGVPIVQVVVADEGNAVRVWFDADLPVGVPVELTVRHVESVSSIEMVGNSTTMLVPFGLDVPPGALPDLKGRFDIANPQTERDANGGPLGTFSVTESGDLGNDTGRINLRKRIFRRITTRPGGFFHLPNYGIRQKDKTLVTPTMLRELQTNLESQVRSEPDVVAVRIEVQEMAPGVFRIMARVQDSLGAFEVDGLLDMNGGADA
jgi:hypothetical protein